MIRGGKRVGGTVRASGFKHALVSVVGAAIGADQPLVVQNCPDIEETRVLAELVRAAGGQADFRESVLTVDGAGISTANLPSQWASRIHGSVYLLPALLGRFGRLQLPVSGGCQIGEGPGGRRPTEHYLRIFKEFGARCHVKPDGSVVVEADRLTGKEIDLLDYTHDRALRTGPLYSGATKTALLTAAMAEGTSVLRSPYAKPDVTELVAVLKAYGVPITKESDDTLVVTGSGGLLPGLAGTVTHELIPDLIELVTWIAVGALLAHEPFVVTGPRMADARTALAPECAVLDALGVSLVWGYEKLVIFPATALAPVDVLVASHGVFSDSQPLLALLASRAPGRSTITETVWSHRFGYAEGLSTLGMSVQNSGTELAIEGRWDPSPRDATIAANDLRGAAALLIAALLTPGATILTGADHLARGYPDLPGALVALGADICTMTAIPEPSESSSRE